MAFVPPQDSPAPITPKDAARPLSAGLFLAVFLPVVSAGGAGLLSLLVKTSDLQGSLGRLEGEVKHLEDSTTSLANDSKTQAADLRKLQDDLGTTHADLRVLIAKLGLPSGP